MKKFKLFALAAFAMLSTNAFAGEVKQDYTYQGLVYTLTADDADATVATAVVKSISDDETYTVKTTWEIPASFKALSTSGAGEHFADKTFTVVGIAGEAFANNSNVTTITFAKAENITSIAKDAFKKTSITSLDLSGTKIETLNELFEPVNTKVTEIKLPATLKVIGANAFEGLSVLTSIVFSNTETGIEVNSEAFKNTMALTTLEFPKVKVTVKANSFKGSYISTLTFNGEADVQGAFGSDELTAITFNGNVKAAAASLTGAKLVTYNFNANLTAGYIIASAFKRVGDKQTITVNYKPTDEGLALGFDQEAFGEEGATKWATFKTTEAYGVKITKAAGDGGLGWKTDGSKYGVTVDYTPTTPDPTTIKVANKEGSSSSYYYGTWFSTAKAIKIAKKQTDAGNVMVYGAYVDNAKEGTAILMDQLTLIGGYYYVPKETPVIVKASKNAPVVYEENKEAALNSVKYKYDKTTLASEIKWNDGASEKFAKDIKDVAAAAVGGPYVVYFLAPIEQYGFLWSKFKDNTIVATGAAGGFYVYAKEAAGARLNVIWLDGSEEDEATAIKAVKTAAEKGAIYNLAGQKVNASYKGVVIKDGKKYIQK